jgi:uncharacterized protein YciI
MMRTLGAVSLAMTLILLSARHQTMPALDSYQVVFLKKGSAWTATQTEESKKIQAGHMANINSMAASGNLLAAGPIAEDNDLRGIFIFKALSQDEVKKLVEADPAIQAGRLRYEVLPWMGTPNIGKKFQEDFIKDPKTKQTMTVHYLGLAVRASGWKSSEQQGVSVDHVKYVLSLLSEKKARAAGPFNHDADPRGMYIFAAKSMSEAQQWIDTDPAVKAGHLSVKLYPWYVASEVWP